MDGGKILRPILILSEIFTMASVRITRNHQYDPHIRFATTKRNIIYYIRMVVLLAVVIFCVIFRQHQQSIYNSSGVITTSVQFAHYNCRIPITILCLMVTNFHASNVVDFLNAFVQIDAIFSKQQVSVAYKRMEKVAFIVVAITLLKIFIQHLPYFVEVKAKHIWSWLVSGLNWDLVDFLDYIIFNLPLILIHILTSQWIIYLNVLQMYFVTLNGLLKSLKYGQCWVVNDYIKVYRNPEMKRRNSPVETIRNAGLIYDDLCLQGDRINHAFAWQILFVVPALFILIIFSSFNVCQMIKDKVAFDVKTIIFDVLYFMSFLELVMPCVFLKEEADKFVDNLHRIDVNCGGASDIDDMMNTITLQTYHQKIEFSAFGVFPLDGTLIYSIFGALTTYLVILLQFDV